MLRHLARDTGSQFALLSLLLMTDIASLVVTCRDWSCSPLSSLSLVLTSRLLGL